MHTAERLVPYSSLFKVGIIIAEKCKSPSSDHILTDLIQAGVETL
jgi:hypothetical protein